MTSKPRGRPSDSEAKGWFLTYPRCPLALQDVLNHLRALQLPWITEYVICTEKHADGHPHVHAFVQHSTKVMFGAHRWDIAGYHGNYQKARSWRGSLTYLKKDKEDGTPKVQGEDYITNIDIDAALAKKAARNRQLMTEDPVKLVEQGVITVFQVPQLVIACKILKDLKEPVLPRCEGFIPNAFGILMPIRQGKQRHFWLWSAAPNTGKTTFLETLSKEHPCYLFSQQEKYQDTLRETTQFLLFDEYSSPTLTLTHLNTICDGTAKHPRKGTSAVSLDKPTVIICGNKPPEEVYTSETSWPLIRARFVVIELTNVFDAL